MFQKNYKCLNIISDNLLLQHNQKLLMKQIILKSRNPELRISKIDKNINDSVKNYQYNLQYQNEFKITGLDHLIKKKVDSIDFYINKQNHIENKDKLYQKRRKKSDSSMNQYLYLNRMSKSPQDYKQSNKIIIPSNHNKILLSHIYQKKLDSNYQKNLQKIDSGIIQFTKQSNNVQEFKSKTNVKDLFESQKKSDKILMKMTEFDFGLQKKFSKCKVSDKLNQRDKCKSISEHKSQQFIESNRNLIQKHRKSAQKFKKRNESRLSELNREKIIHKILNIQYLKKKIKKKPNNEISKQNDQQIDGGNFQIIRRKQKCIKNKKNKTECIFYEKQQNQMINNLHTYSSDYDNYKLINLKGNSIFSKTSKMIRAPNNIYKMIRAFKFRNTGISIKNVKQNRNSNHIKYPSHEQKITPWNITSNEEDELGIY